MNITIFSRILQRLPKNNFNELVKKNIKPINILKELTLGLIWYPCFSTRSKSNSFRDIHYGLNSATGNLNNYEVRKFPSKSSLSYINEHRDWRLFRNFYLAVVKNLNLSRNDKRRLKLKRKNIITGFYNY